MYSNYTPIKMFKKKKRLMRKDTEIYRSQRQRQNRQETKTRRQRQRDGDKKSDRNRKMDIHTEKEAVSQCPGCACCASGL